ncbi:putative LytR family regulatory protein [Mobilicoccus pelagius NBRC 104925]|uniref:Putative LytR family regulatory protein n=1 Tax=Mobilicoccus pelagius NBRC 104925 TaxID=1089455 RepID=H5UMF0_9MICO|nr:putative LytR family regulatory protein [Mobilicoccus pelagius NBRC 104925]
MLAVLLVLLLALAGAGLWGVRHLSGNLRTAPVGDGGGRPATDSWENRPVGVLVIGSDARESEADCKLGGACTSTDTNGDVMLLVHLAADRSNATVMSIPRDTMAELPTCTDAKTGTTIPAHRGMINSALKGGPSCQASAVHRLTGIPVDHFAMVDFEGVVTMSDAIGGVPVCVDADVYDTYSHLKLSKGEHTLVGPAALQFVRSRHAFGDGSDHGRTQAQHLFLSSMIRELKSAGTLSDPVALYRLADAATKAVTVDTGLGSVDKLVGLAAEGGKVPADRITFTTMPTTADPKDPNRLVPTPAAKTLWAKIIADESLSRPAPTASSTPGATGASTSSGASSPSPSTPSESSNSTEDSTSGSGSSPSPSGTRRATTPGCAAVSPFKTVKIDGVPMTPSRAYEVGTKKGIPDSDAAS